MLWKEVHSKPSWWLEALHKPYLRYLAIVQGARQGSLIDDPATCHINYACALLHLAKGVIIEHPLRCTQRVL